MVNKPVLQEPTNTTGITGQAKEKKPKRKKNKFIHINFVKFPFIT